MADNQLFQLTGKVALITGASKGIGEQIARYLAQFGAKVVISSRRQADLDELAEDIRKTGGEVTAIEARMGDEAQTKHLFDKTVEVYGGIDILVNNAAANPYYGPTVDCPDNAYDKIMDINVKAPFQLSKLVYPVMKLRGGGSIINISSIAGETPDPGLGIYSVSKASINMLTKVLAKEWGADGIRVNAVAPGLIKTKFSQALWQDEKTLAHFTKRLPIARMGTVEEVASLVLYLASDASGYCTGGIYTVDGGTTI
ncbi:MULTISPECIES: SDR family NAD(P)-dependent oxidoreductase [Runella]|uniref:NAD(P)-dependent dehydrogenase (Short-subunit alcohol dehydrogenase family) n=1 Tax=Runella defluvii TaxID=370973 RepID=A0A7W5ZIY1_9BACT|nr:MULTISPECIES: glucose 1-dehydrogenase [Runella]MBB3837683.1 NAD(P)-dependent dehydrogenase (short-subunit alcohol dehydrogenase family) [Runella defluvii]HAK75403.1 3-oxoacyl-ACP reductase [Runella sp.]